MHVYKTIQKIFVKILHQKNDCNVCDYIVYVQEIENYGLVWFGLV